MNTAFRIVWSHARQAFVVTDEHTAARGKCSGTRRILAGLGLSLLAGAIHADPLCAGPTTTISTAASSTCNLGAGDSLVVSETGSISTTPDFAVYSDAGFGTISNAGNLISGGSSLYYGDAAISLNAFTTGISGTSISNLADATIQGSDFGITVFGTDAYAIGSLDNAGTISAVGDNSIGIRLDNTVFSGGINNSGAISGEQFAIWASSQSDLGTLNNSGTINSAMTGLLATTSSIDLFDNSGTISGGDSGLLLYNSSIDLLDNSGMLQGDNQAVTIDDVSGIDRLDNSGTISSGYTGVALNNGSNIGQLDNSGTILGSTFGLAMSTASIDLLDNSGTLHGDAQAVVMDADSSIDRVDNRGTISADYRGLELGNSSSIDQLDNSGTISGASAIVLDTAASIGAIDNSGTISGIYDGILAQGGANVDHISNSGTISSYESAIAALEAHIGQLDNSGTLSGPYGLLAYQNSSITQLNNSGTIDADSLGINVSSDSSLGRLVNSGTINSNFYAILVTNGASLDNIDITGTAARITGDVRSGGTTFTVKSAAEFTSENAYEVGSFIVEDGATLHMGAGSSTSERLNDGITVNDGFFNTGTVSLAAGTTGAIHGDYTQTSSGVLKIGITDQDYGKLTVDGTAKLASNAHIVVDVANPDYSFSAKNLQDVLSATILSSDGTFNVSDNSQLFNFGAVKDGNTVDLTLTSTASVLDSVTQSGNTPARDAAVVLDEEFASNPGGELASAFVGLINEQEVSDAVSQTLPVLAGSSLNTIGNTLSGIDRVVQERQNSTSGLSSGDPLLGDENVWIKSFGSWADQNERSGVSGFDADTKGLAIGADAAVSTETRLGLAFAYARSDIDSDSSIAPQSLQVDTFQLIGYGSYSLAPDTELNVQVGAGRHNNDGKRQMSFADATAKADYNSTSAHAGVGLEHTLRFADELTFVPSVRADYTWIEDESYHEKGAGALNLEVDERDAEALILGVDGKLAYDLSEQSEVSANLGVGYDLINEQAAITSIYAGAADAAFTTHGLDPSPWLSRAGLGLTHNLVNGTEVSLRYDVESRSDFLNQGASVKARWAF